MVSEFEKPPKFAIFVIKYGHFRGATLEKYVCPGKGQNLPILYIKENLPVILPFAATRWHFAATIMLFYKKWQHFGVKKDLLWSETFIFPIL